MATKSKTKTRLSIAALFAGALVGAPLTAARADEPMTAEATRYDAMAETLAPTPAVTEQMLEAKHNEKVQEHLEALGGVAYKSSIDEQARAKERAYEQMGEQVQTPNPSCQPTKPAADILCKQQQR